MRTPDDYMLTRRRKAMSMILRIWRGRADHARADVYPRHFREQVVPDLLKVDGFLGAHLVRRRVRGVTSRRAALSATTGPSLVLK